MKSPKISELLENINRTANNANFSNPAKLEIDLLMQQLRDLYEVLDALRSGKAENSPAAEVTTEAEVKPSRRVVNPNQNVLLNEPLKQEVKEDLKKQVEVITPEIKAEVAEIIQPEVLHKEPEVKAEPIVRIEVKQTEVKQTTTVKTSINESVVTTASINEKLKTSSQEVHRKLSTKPLKDLIDLNKKFILQNELFKGSSDAFSKAITHIDQLNDYEQARAYVSNELSPEYGWDTGSQALRLLVKLVKQKFGVE